MPSAPAIRLELRRSRWPTALLAIALVAGSVSLVLAPWPFWLRLVVVTVWWLFAAWLLRRWCRSPRVEAASWRADGSWLLELAGERRPVPVELSDHRVVGPLLALRLATPDRRRRFELTLWPDSTDRDELRRLRIRLARTGGPGAGDQERSG